MPVIARLQHCVILMYFRDHNPPHFHVDTPDAQAQLTIRTLRVIRGSVDRQALREAQEWAMANREQLWARWEEFNMTDMLRIVLAEALEGGILRLSWDDGVTRNVDVRMWLRRHPLLESLNDSTVFAQVEIMNRGGGVGWPNGADFCAQALRLLSDDQEAVHTRVSA